MSLLKERYDNRRIIIQKYMQALFDLSKISKDSAFFLGNSLVEALRHIRALSV